jgi:hypothetical protein
VFSSSTVVKHSELCDASPNSLKCSRSCQSALASAEDLAEERKNRFNSGVGGRDRDPEGGVAPPLRYPSDIPVAVLEKSAVGKDQVFTASADEARGLDRDAKNGSCVVAASHA